MPGWRISGPVLDEDDHARIAAGDVASVLTRWQAPVVPVDQAAADRRHRRNKAARRSRRINRQAAKR